MRCNCCLQAKQEVDFYASNKKKCKECIKASVRQNRLDKLDYYRQFDRARSSSPERVAAREAYAKTPEGRIAGARAKEKWAVANAVRRKASHIVGNAIRDGKLERQPCFMCGGKAQAHHPDYGRPLDVTWLCPEHHKAAHRAAAEILYAAGRKETLHF